MDDLMKFFKKSPVHLLRLLLPRMATLLLGVLALITISRTSLSNPKEHPKIDQLKDGMIRVAIIQGNQSDIQEQYPSPKNFTVDVYLSLSDKAMQFDPDFIVWPESAIQRFTLRLPELRDRLYQLVKKRKSHIILGTPDYDQHGYQYNSAFVISPTGKILGRHDKVYLTPTETNYSAGNILSTIQTPFGSIGIIICYESAFPQIARSLVKQGAKLLFILTDDSGFRKSAAPFLHANEAILRAVENRVYVIQAANTGISQVIDPLGKVLMNSSLGQQDIIYASVSTGHPMSTYAKVGDIFSYLCMAVTVIGLVFAILNRSPQCLGESMSRIVLKKNPKNRFMRLFLGPTIIFLNCVMLICILMVASLVKVGYDNTTEKHKSFSIQQSIQFVSDYFHDPEIE